MATSAKLKATPTKATTSVAVKKPSGALVDIRAQLQAEVATLAFRTAPAGGDAIRVTQDKKFLFPDGTKHAGPIKLVILDFVTAHNFYQGAFDANNITPPACFAVGDKPTEMVPSDNSPLKQSASCSSCPMNQYGSSPTGGGKACNNQRILAVLPPGATADTPLMILKCSATALKPFDAYVNSVARQFNLPPVGVLTEVSFDDNVTYASLRFSNPEPNDDLEVCFARKEEARARLLIEPDVSQFETAAPKKAAMPHRK